MTRIAISPRFATRTFSNIRGSLGGAELCPLAHPDDLVSAGADADEADRGADGLLDEGEVVARLLRQVGLGTAVADLGLEARQLLVLGDGVVDDRLVVGEVVEDGAL